MYIYQDVDVSLLQESSVTTYTQEEEDEMDKTMELLAEQLQEVMQEWIYDYYIYSNKY
jgi:hypothetical protein